MSEEIVKTNVYRRKSKGCVLPRISKLALMPLSENGCSIAVLLHELREVQSLRAFTSIPADCRQSVMGKTPTLIFFPLSAILFCRSASLLARA